MLVACCGPAFIQPINHEGQLSSNGLFITGGSTSNLGLLPLQDSAPTTKSPSLTQNCMFLCVELALDNASRTDDTQIFCESNIETATLPFISGSRDNTGSIYGGVNQHPGPNQ